MCVFIADNDEEGIFAIAHVHDVLLRLVILVCTLRGAGIFFFSMMWLACFVSTLQIAVLSLSKHCAFFYVSFLCTKQ
jgi:hypothetical protein